jgi:hypothetical protein
MLDIFFSVVKLEEEALLCAAEYIRNYFVVQVMVLFAAVFFVTSRFLLFRWLD